MILKHMTPFQQRLIVSTVGFILALAFIFFSNIPAFKPIFTAAIAVAIGIAAWEFYQIAIVKGIKPAATLGISLGTIYVFAVALSTQYTEAKMLPVISLFAALLCSFLYYFAKGNSPFINLPITFFSIAYLYIPLSCMLSITYFFSINGIQDGRLWIFYLIIVTKMTDIGGFFIGKQFGKQKLAPYISPKKTWEGALGGFFSAILASVIVKMISSLTDGEAFALTTIESLWLGALLGIVAQFGDLAESLLKRDGGVKDSSRLPGLGGILDVVDSLVFTAPLLYIFLRIYAK